MPSLPSTSATAPPSRLARLPFFYGWVVVAVAFVTMAVGVNTRTAFSLLFPPILAEFGWDRGQTAAAFSVGFVAAICYAPLIGMLMDRFGPRLVIPFGTLDHLDLAPHPIYPGVTVVTIRAGAWVTDLVVPSDSVAERLLRAAAESGRP